MTSTTSTTMPTTAMPVAPPVVPTPKMEYQAFGFQKHGKKMEIITIENFKPLEANEMRISVAAASLNPIDYKRRDGALKMFVSEKRWPALMGYDVSGIVECVGSNVKRFKVGDRIVAQTREPGTVATQCVVEQDLAVVVPENIELIRIAGLPLAGQTALQMLTKAKVREGSQVLVSGGKGGVGSFVIQLAKKHFKASRVVVTCSVGHDHMAHCFAMGADEVLVHEKGKDEFKEYTGQFDAIIDLVGNATSMFKCGRHGAICVSSIAQPTPDSIPNTGGFLNGLFSISSYFTSRSAQTLGVTYEFHWCIPNGNDLELLVDLVKQGKIEVKVDSEFRGLAQAQAAYDKLEEGHASGKILVVM